MGRNMRPAPGFAKGVTLLSPYSSTLVIPAKAET
ncbi:hypothetical protein HME9302_01303 [Alteripontixanthobacter maritimus]|uniref:Uncharacterized protein n=1 Tax=Alteripontixanthobacter maritimus TaxID=2161824 RepID=A0A369Q5V9_9SPHN|nr:hypothetical protein HME9302_01303 [Alteripontixanthobacter maritimus]